MINKFRNYLARGFVPYLGWNANNYNDDGSPKSTFSWDVPAPLTPEQKQIREDQIRKQIDTAFRVLKKPLK